MTTTLEGQSIWTTTEPTLEQILSGDYTLPVNFKVVDAETSTYKIISFVFDSVNGARRLELGDGNLELNYDLFSPELEELDTNLPQGVKEIKPTANELFFASNLTDLLKSSDGITWQNVQLPSTHSQIHRIYYFSNINVIYVVCFDKVFIGQSNVNNNDYVFTECNIPPVEEQWQDRTFTTVTYNRTTNQVLLMGLCTYSYISNDLINFIQVDKLLTPDSIATDGIELTSFCWFIKDRYYAFLSSRAAGHEQPYIGNSADGITWDVKDTDEMNRLYLPYVYNDGYTVVLEDRSQRVTNVIDVFSGEISSSFDRYRFIVKSPYFSAIGLSLSSDFTSNNESPRLEIAKLTSELNVASFTTNLEANPFFENVNLSTEQFPESNYSTYFNPYFINHKDNNKLYINKNNGKLLVIDVSNLVRVKRNVNKITSISVNSKSTTIDVDGNINIELPESQQGDFIPLTGTEEGKNISGPLKFDSLDISCKKITTDEGYSDFSSSIKTKLLKEGKNFEVSSSFESGLEITNFEGSDYNSSVTFLRANKSLLSLSDQNVYNSLGNRIEHTYSLNTYSDEFQETKFNGFFSSHLTEESALTDNHFVQKAYVDSKISAVNSYTTEEIETGGVYEFYFGGTLVKQPIYRKTVIIQGSDLPANGILNLGPYFGYIDALLPSRDVIIDRRSATGDGKVYHGIMNSFCLSDIIRVGADQQYVIYFRDIIQETLKDMTSCASITITLEYVKASYGG